MGGEEPGNLPGGSGELLGPLPSRQRFTFWEGGSGETGEEREGWCPNSVVIYGKVLDQLEAGKPSWGGRPLTWWRREGVREL